MRRRRNLARLNSRDFDRLNQGFGGVAIFGKKFGIVAARIYRWHWLVQTVIGLASESTAAGADGVAH